MKFINQMVKRLEKCEQLFAETGTFQRECLFDEAVIPDDLKVSSKLCFDISFETDGDYESINFILQ